VQVDPMKPDLKPPRIKRLKLKFGYISFNFCFQIQLASLQRGPDVWDLGRSVQIYSINTCNQSANGFSA